MPIQNVADALPAGLDEDRESQRLMLQFAAVVHRLPGKADPQIATVPLEDPELPHHVMNDLAAAAEGLVVDGGGEILQPDPAGHDHRGGHDRLEYLAAGVFRRAVLVEERAAAEVEPRRPAAVGDDDGGVAREPPFGPNLRPVARPEEQRLVGGVPQPPTALLPRRVSGGGGPREHVPKLLVMRGRTTRRTEKLDLIGGGPVHGRHEPGVGGNHDALVDERRTNLDVVEDGRGNSGVRLAGMTTAGTAVVARLVGIVDHGGGMPADGHDPREPVGEPEIPQHARGQADALVEREGIVGTVEVGAEPSLLVEREAVVPRVGHGARDAEGVGEQLRQIGEPQRLHEAVAGDRRRLEPLPELPAFPEHFPMVDGRGDPLPRCPQQTFEDRKARLQQHRAMGRAVRGAQPNELQRHPEESGETEGLGPVALGLEVASQHLAANVDAEHHLQRRPAGRRRLLHGGDVGQQTPAMGDLTGHLHQVAGQHRRPRRGRLGRLRHQRRGQVFHTAPFGQRHVARQPDRQQPRQVVGDRR